MDATGAHILLIDDDPYIHDAVRMVLEPEGYRVTGRLTAPDGLKAMQEDPPDLLLLDIMLATPSEGFHLAYEIRGREELRHIPIIVLSAVGKAMGMNFAREVGTEYLPVDRFLEKPFEAATLREAVRQALRTEGDAE